MALAGMWWWRRRPFRVEVEGSSMLPSLRPGDWLIAVRPGRLRVGDVVVAEHPARPGFDVVKRVRAGPGDQVGDRVLGEGEYWLLGDHEEASSDSRSFGPVPTHAIRGAVRVRYWPLNRSDRRSAAGSGSAGSFDGFAEGYDRITSVDPPVAGQWMLRHLPARRDRALDLGCGAGRHVDVLGDRFGEVVGIDLSRPLVEVARRRRARPNVRYEVADLRTFTDLDGFDLVFSSTTLHHVPDLESVLRRVRALVRPGGTAILVDCVAWWPTPPRWVYRAGAIWSLPGEWRRMGGPEAWWRYRFKTSRPWLDHLSSDQYLSRGAFERTHSAVFPGATFHRVGRLYAMVWKNGD